jgi:leucyl aminopeptidase
MKITLAATPVFQTAVPIAVLFVHEQQRPLVPAKLAPLLRGLTAKEFQGRDQQTCLLRTAGKRLLLVGLGKRAGFTPEKMRRAAGQAIKTIAGLGLTRAAWAVTPDQLAPATEAALLANYRFTKYKAPTDNHVALKSLTFHLPAGADLPAARATVQRAEIIGGAANYARAIANLPGNVIHPPVLADYARQTADELGLTCTILDKAALEAGGFGGLLAVGGGSAQEPRLIVLEYNPEPGTANRQPIALVGKAITFDSGGISIKPADKMDEMKFDKAGGLAVLGALRAVAQLRLPVPVLGIIAAAENLPSGTSYRPGDIVTSYRGKDKRGFTIEVLNTDAEGRIILGDALAYARERQPAAIIDLATLTGACVVALGAHAAGLLGNNDQLLDAVRAAGERVGERCWPMPLWAEYKEMIKSDVADHKNTGGRYAGASTAAAFLAKYVGDVPWAHIDIAGTANITEERPYHAKGATGFGVRLLLDLLQNWKP